MANSYNWQEQYHAALIETDDSKLMDRILAAQAAINSRVREMQAKRDGTLEERQALADAVSGLQILRKEAGEK
jgi:IS5 family transposase